MSPTPLECFKEHFNNCTEALDAAGYSKSSLYRVFLAELISASFVCADSAALLANIDRAVFLRDIFEWYAHEVQPCSDSNIEKITDHLGQRIHFYQDILTNHISVRDDIFINKPIPSENAPPFYKIALSFSHCLLDVQLIHHYNSSVQLAELSDVEIAYATYTFCSIEFLSLFHDILPLFESAETNSHISAPVNVSSTRTTESALIRVFKEHYVSIQNVLAEYSKKHPDKKPLFSDVGPLMYVISDLSLSTTYKNRTLATKEISEWYFSLFENTSKEKVSAFFNKRINFYAEIVRGKLLHADCLPGVDLSIFENNPAHRCAIAFSDCVMNRKYIYDYDNSPSPLYNPLDVFEITDTVLHPIMDELVLLYNDIQNTPYSPAPGVHVCISSINDPPITQKKKYPLLYRLCKWITNHLYS